MFLLARDDIRSLVTEQVKAQEDLFVACSQPESRPQPGDSLQTVVQAFRTRPGVNESCLRVPI